MRELVRDERTRTAHAVGSADRTLCGLPTGEGEPDTKTLRCGICAALLGVMQKQSPFDRGTAA